MEKSKQMIEENEEEDKSTDYETDSPFDFSEVRKNIVTSLVFKNQDISIYHAYSNKKQYTIVAYFANKLNTERQQNFSYTTKSSRIQKHRKKLQSRANHFDEQLNAIQSFYEELQDLQQKNIDYSKNMMQILHISREQIQLSKSYLSQSSPSISPNILHQEINLNSSFNSDIENDVDQFCSNNHNNIGRQQTKSFLSNEEDNERDTLLIFFESYERSIEEDIAERSLNQNNILYEEHILESFCDMIDCFQLLGNSLMQFFIVNSDYLVICREKLTKILPICDRNTITNSSEMSPFRNSKVDRSNQNDSKITITKKNIDSPSNALPNPLLNGECRTRLQQRIHLQNQNLVNNLNTPVQNQQKHFDNSIQHINKIQNKNSSEKVLNFTSIIKLQNGNHFQNSSINLNIVSSQSKSNSLNESTAQNSDSIQNNKIILNSSSLVKVMTRSARLKQIHQKETDSYFSSTMEVEMAGESQNDNGNGFEIRDEENNSIEIENVNTSSRKQSFKQKQKIEDINKDDQASEQEKDDVDEGLEEEESQEKDEDDEIIDENGDEIVDDQDIFSGYTLQTSKLFTNSQNSNIFKITQDKKQGTQNKLMHQSEEKQNINRKFDALINVEKRVLEELSIVYLRLSAFLTAIKFNPHKKNKEIRISEIIKSLIEYKISSLFSDIFAECSFSMNGFNLTNSTLKEMVQSYRQQKYIVDISETTDLSQILTSLIDKTDITINYKDKTLAKLEELKTILCSSSENNQYSTISSSQIRNTKLSILNSKSQTPTNESLQNKSRDLNNHQSPTNNANFSHDLRWSKNTYLYDNTNFGKESKSFTENNEDQQNQNDQMEIEQQNKRIFFNDNFNIYNGFGDWFSLITSFEFKADLCRLGDEGTLMISSILERIPPLQLKHLILSLRRNSISEIGIFGIAKYVEKCKNLQTFRIFFSYNRIKDAGLTSILRSIVTLEQLQVLDLRFFDNQITAEGCKGFQDLQDVKFKDIKYLNMSLGNNLISDEGCRLLSLFLCNIRNVKQLSIFLESNQINSSGIAHLKNVFVRKNQIKYLILHALSNKIEDDGIIKILENIAKLTTLHSLEIILNENQLTEKAGVVLGQTIKSMVHLTSLILSVRNNKISNKGVNSIAVNLKNLKKLESLVLSLTNNNISGDGGVLIGKNLKHLTNLQKLHLVFYENSINHKSGKAIGEGLSNLRDLNYLILGIGDNNVGDEGAVAIGNCMLNLSKVKIFEIYLQNNEVGSNGASSIARGLQNMRNLKCLVFQIQHSDLGDKPIVELGKSIQNLKQLKSLDIYVERCNIGEEGGNALGKGLFHLQNLKVMVLDLDSNNIGPRGGKSLGDAFTNMHGLIDLKLYLKKNNMMPEGGQGLFEGIQYLRKLKSLNIDLYKNYTGDNSIITCGRALTTLKELRNLELSITYNAITQTGAQQFSEYFAQCTFLHEVYLYMQKNNITPKGAEYIGNALSCLKDLQQLKISFGNNRIENQGISNLIKGVSFCESLRVLYLYAYNIGMTGEGCIQIAGHLKKMKKLERFEFFPSANSQINLKNGLAQIAQSVIENHETLQNVRVDIPYWEEKIKTFIKPRINNQIQTIQTILFNRLISSYMICNPKAIHWDLFIE